MSCTNVPYNSQRKYLVSNLDNSISVYRFGLYLLIFWHQMIT